MIRKNKLPTTLAIAAVTAATFGMTVFAAETKQSSYTVTIKDAADSKKEIRMSEWKDGKYGIKYYDIENGVRISISQAADNKAMKLPQKTDEKGDNYVELKDKSRVYVSKANSVCAD